MNAGTFLGPGRRRLPIAAAFLVPALLTLRLSFDGGGYFAGDTAQIAALLALFLVARVTLAENPFAGFGRPLAMAGVALGLFVLWTLLSALWSGSPARALVEFDRALAYWLALILFGSFAGDVRMVNWAFRGTVVAFWIVCAVAFVTRVLPELWPIEPTIVNERLSYPLTYWNALGMMAALGLLAALHFGTSEREPPALRAAGAAAAPLMTATLVLTFSRGAIAAGLVALFTYLVLARPWGALAGLPTMALGAAVAAVAAYRADLLATENPTTAAAVAQGGRLAVVVGIAMIVCGAARLLLVRADRRLAKVETSPRVRRRVWIGAAAVVVVGMTVAFFALDGGNALQRQADRFVQGGGEGGSGAVRSRLTNPGNNGRIDHWAVALDSFADAPVKGAGAGMYAIEWNERREIALDTHDAHSLYLELLAELGVVGLALLAILLVTILIALGRRVRGPRRHLYAAIFAAVLGWVVHAGMDWDWEMPAVTLWLFALGGMVLARPAEDGRIRRVPARFTRVTVGVGCLALAVSPALVALSQARLDDAASSFEQGDCDGAIRSALTSIKAMPVRPEPYELLSFCDARRDQHFLAIATARRMIELDSRWWEAHYTLAIARANAGKDPRAAAAEAYRLNPREPRTRYARRHLARKSSPQEWRRRARAARLPLL